MLRKLITILGLSLAGADPGMAADAHAPYAKPEADVMYNLLFGDDPTPFRPKTGETPTPWQATIFAKAPDPTAVLALADDPTTEGRVRALAYGWLRQHRHPVPKQKLLGVIVEVALEGGLDTLAAFSDGGVRYLNQSGKIAVVEGGVPAIQPIVADLFTAARTIVKAIGPWDKPRLAPPGKGMIRLTFLVSDGLYFGQGPLKDLSGDALAGPVIEQATRLLQAVVKASTK